MSNIQIESSGYGTASIKVDGVEMNRAVGWPVVIGADTVTLSMVEAALSVEVEGDVVLDEATVSALHALGWSHPDVAVIERRRVCQTDHPEFTIPAKAVTE